MDYILLLPIILESIDFLEFSLKFDFFPLSFGSVIFWMLSLKNYNKALLKNQITSAFFIIITGLFLSGTLTDTAPNDLSRTVAFLISLISGVFFAHFLFQKGYIRKVYLFFWATNCYWVYYVLNLFLSGKISTEFHFNSNNQNIETTNSHTISIAVSFSSIFLFHYYLSTGGFRNKLIAYTVFSISILTLFLAQSRSNLVITLFIGIVVFLISNKRKIKLQYFFISVFLFFAFLNFLPFIASKFGDSESSISKRYSLEEKDYQESTTNARKLVYFAFADRISQNFFGTGIVKPKLYLGTSETTNLLMHNQYATWVVAGGWISLIGVVYLMFCFIKYYLRFFRSIRFLSRETFSLNLALLCYFLTLFTVEQSSLIFFVFTGLLIYQYSFFFRKSS